VPSTDKKTEFSKIKEVAVFKIFSKYSNFLKRVFIDLVREKLKKKIDFECSSSPIYDFPMISL